MASILKGWLPSHSEMPGAAARCFRGYTGADAQERTPVVRDNRKEERATSSLGSTIVHITRVDATDERLCLDNRKGDGVSIL